jgi:hypothetical protein
LVLGSGRTWPQDFLFFVGFLSPKGPGVPASCENSSMFPSSSYDWGVMMSRGFIVLSAGVEAASKRDGYISLGVERKDSAGEWSNLAGGGDDVVLSQEASMVTNQSSRRGGLVCLLCAVLCGVQEMNVTAARMMRTTKDRQTNLVAEQGFCSIEAPSQFLDTNRQTNKRC